MIKYRNKLKEVDLNKSYKIIRKPIVTEKATKLSEFNKVVFEVAFKSNKKEMGVFKSIILGLLLTIVAAIPSMILYGLYSQ